ncbi:MAG TPA: YkgJ family cysteine cluster protein [Acidobacteriota bacterium]|nr:YkgJ family cysteine cluster protein [Acidobacteriota bacterium]
MNNNTRYLMFAPGENPERRMVMRAVELRTADGVLRGQVTIDTGPMRLSELVPTACELTNVLVTRAGHREKREGRSVSCRAGCGACCRQMVPLSPPEVFYVADLVATLKPDLRRLISHRFTKVVDVLEKEDLIGQLLDPEYTDEPVLAIARTYFGLGLPCPFLLAESCSIHQHRPVACREYNVTSPADWCGDPYNHEIAKIPMPLPFSAPLARLTGELTGTKPRLIPLTLALSWAAENADLRRRTWPGLELFEQFMGLLGTAPGPVDLPLDRPGSDA